MATDGRTERPTNAMKLTVAFRNFANAPNNYLHSTQFKGATYSDLKLGHPQNTNL